MTYNPSLTTAPFTSRCNTLAIVVANWARRGCETHGWIDGLCENTWAENVTNPKPLYDGVVLWRNTGEGSHETGVAAFFEDDYRICVVRYTRRPNDTLIDEKAYFTPCDPHYYDLKEAIER